LSLNLYLYYLFPLILSRNVCLVFAWGFCAGRHSPFNPVFCISLAMTLCILVIVSSECASTAASARTKAHVQNVYVFRMNVHRKREKVDCVWGRLPFRLIFFCFLLARGGHLLSWILLRRYPPDIREFPRINVYLFCRAVQCSKGKLGSMNLAYHIFEFDFFLFSRGILNHEYQWFLRNSS